MKRRITGVMLLVVIVSLVFASAALAVSQSTIDAIIADAADGTLDGSWSRAEIQAALAWLRNSSLAQQYGDAEGVLEGYLAGSGAPGAGGGELSFTGADLGVALAAGVGLIGAGLLLRRRRA